MCPKSPTPTKTPTRAPAVPLLAKNLVRALRSGKREIIMSSFTFNYQTIAGNKKLFLEKYLSPTNGHLYPGITKMNSKERIKKTTPSGEFITPFIR